jgi:hypothetical protein
MAFVILAAFTIPGRSVMRRIVESFLTVAGFVLLAIPALANVEAGKAPDYSGISYMYYSLIALILAYGVYDTFFKKS